MKTDKELFPLIAKIAEKCLTLYFAFDEPHESNLDEALELIQSLIPADKHQDLHRRPSAGSGPISSQFKEIIEWLDLLVKTTPVHLQRSLQGLTALIHLLECAFFHFDEIEKEEAKMEVNPDEPEPA